MLGQKINDLATRPTVGRWLQRDVHAAQRANRSRRGLRQRRQVVAAFKKRNTTTRWNQGLQSGSHGAKVTGAQVHASKWIGPVRIEPRGKQHPRRSEPLGKRDDQRVERPEVHIAGGVGGNRNIEGAARRLGPPDIIDVTGARI